MFYKKSSLEDSSRIAWSIKYENSANLWNVAINQDFENPTEVLEVCAH